MKRTQSAGGVVLNKKNEVLVVNQRGNSWSLPKGHIEDGEDKIQTAKREVYEESGINQLISFFMRQCFYCQGQNDAD